MTYMFLFMMFFLHVIADFNLQGILASMKQKAWWARNVSVEKYKNDYIICLYIHSFTWSFLITLPWLVYAIILNSNSLYILLSGLYIINTILHAYTDDLKANQLKINLIEDQIIHFLQIISSWGCLIALNG